MESAETGERASEDGHASEPFLAPVSRATRGPPRIIALVQTEGLAYAGGGKPRSTPVRLPPLLSLFFLLFFLLCFPFFSYYFLSFLCVTGTHSLVLFSSVLTTFELT
jgi:hypothetical protein